MVVANMQPKTKIRDKKNIMEGHITLTEREMEYLFRIIDSSTSIFLRHQFFLWAQGEVQSLLPHGLLICMFDEGSGQPISIEKFSRTNISEATFSNFAGRTAASCFASYLHGTWEGTGRFCFVRIIQIALHIANFQTISSEMTWRVWRRMECSTPTAGQEVYSLSRRFPLR